MLLCVVIVYVLFIYEFIFICVNIICLCVVWLPQTDAARVIAGAHAHQLGGTTCLTLLVEHGLICFMRRL